MHDQLRNFKVERDVCKNAVDYFLKKQNICSLTWFQQPGAVGESAAEAPSDLRRRLAFSLVSLIAPRCPINDLLPFISREH